MTPEQMVDDLHYRLTLRTGALGRVAAQLDAVRGLHRPRSRELPAPLQPRIRVECEHCGCIYPCPTAKAAGVPEVSS